MAECRQCGVHIMVPPEDERCPMCGCENMYDYGLEEINREIVRYVKKKVEREKMEKDVLMEEWVKKVNEGWISLHEALLAVFEIGRQTGVDEEKLRIQLSKLGEPYGTE